MEDLKYFRVCHLRNSRGMSAKLYRGLRNNRKNRFGYGFSF